VVEGSENDGAPSCGFDVAVGRGLDVGGARSSGFGLGICGGKCF
jgi:hypothetical protein